MFIYLIYSNSYSVLLFVCLHAFKKPNLSFFLKNIMMNTEALMLKELPILTFSSIGKIFLCSFELK